MSLQLPLVTAAGGAVKKERVARNRGEEILLYQILGASLCIIQKLLKPRSLGIDDISNVAGQ